MRLPTLKKEKIGPKTDLEPRESTNIHFRGHELHVLGECVIAMVRTVDLELRLDKIPNIFYLC